MKEDFEDEDEGPTAWLALAATQWQLGRLDERTRKRAVQIIDTGASLRLWAEDPKLLDRRRGSLVKLRRQLLSKQPAEKEIRPRRAASRSWHAWDRGEYIGYSLRKGTFVILCVLSADNLGISFTLLNWMGSAFPSPRDILQLPMCERGKFIAITKRETDLPIKHLHRLGVVKKLKPDPHAGGGIALRWTEVPYRIKKILRSQNMPDS